MCITNPLKISDFQGNLLHMLLFLQKHAFYFSILRIKEGLLHVQQPLGATGRIRTSGLPGRSRTLYPAELRSHMYEKRRYSVFQSCKVVNFQ